MKKLFLTLGLASLMMVACNNTPTEPEQTNEPAPETTEVVEEKHECPMHALKEQFANWDQLDEAGKTALVENATKLFDEMDAKMAEMKEAGEEACKEMIEMSEEEKAACEAKCAEMKAKWEGFAEKTLDEKKDLIIERLGACDKPCCHHDAPAETPAEAPAE